MSMSTRRGGFFILASGAQGQWPPREGGGKSTAGVAVAWGSGKTNSNYVANARQGQGHITGGAAVAVRYSTDYKILGKRNST